MCERLPESDIFMHGRNVSKCQCHTGTRCQKMTFLTLQPTPTVNVRCECLPTANNPNNPSNLMLTTYRAKMSKLAPWDFRAFAISMRFPRFHGVSIPPTPAHRPHAVSRCVTEKETHLRVKTSKVRVC